MSGTSDTSTTDPQPLPTTPTGYVRLISYYRSPGGRQDGKSLGSVLVPEGTREVTLEMMNQPENKHALPFPPEQCSWKKRRGNRLRVSLKDRSRLDVIKVGPGMIERLY